MAEGKVPSTSIVPLTGSNYATWRIQCRMALIREGLWGLVEGTEEVPDPETDAHSKYVAKRNRALATIVLAIDTSLIYLLGDPVDPTVVGRKLSGQFQKRTWANKLNLRKKLFTMKLDECGSMKEYLKGMVEVFDELAIVAEPVSDEDKVIYLLAGLPESYDVLVTALESGSETVPALDSVTERLLREEEKLKSKEYADKSKKLLLTNSRKQVICYFCKKPGHMKKDCRKFALTQVTSEQTDSRALRRQTRNRRSKEDAMLISNALVAKSRNDWIIDSGASSHMCNDRAMFRDISNVADKVTLGDGSSLSVIGRGTVALNMLMTDVSARRCILKEVLYVPKLAFNLVSVSRATESGKTVYFDDCCEFRNEADEVIARRVREGSLFYLKLSNETDDVANMVQVGSKKNLWHRRFWAFKRKRIERTNQERIS